ncbi:MAG: acyltransferase family protein [Clostridia bacterium]|nr:acyltransferase family protein [Clostridia bacterium]
MNNKRVFYIDALRVLSIFSVVVLHICAIDWYTAAVNTYHWQVLNFYDGLMRFCVPIFIMISGAFLLSSKKDYSLKDIFLKKILRVVTGFLFWSFVYLVFCKDFEIASEADFVHKWLTGSRYHLWFPFTIICLYIISPILKEVCKSKKACEYFIILWFIFQCVGMATGIFPSLNSTIATLKVYLTPQAVLGYSGYFVLGHYLSVYDITKKVRISSYILALLGVFVTIAGTGYMSLRYGSGYGLFYEYLMPNTVFVCIGVFLFFKYNVKGKAFTALVGVLSRLSFGIYFVHDLFIYILNHELGVRTGFINPIVSVPLLSVVVFTLSTAVAFIIDKIPFVRKYII